MLVPTARGTATLRPRTRRPPPASGVSGQSSDGLLSGAPELVETKMERPSRFDRRRVEDAFFHLRYIAVESLSLHHVAPPSRHVAHPQSSHLLHRDAAEAAREPTADGPER